MLGFRPEISREMPEMVHQDAERNASAALLGATLS